MIELLAVTLASVGMFSAGWALRTHHEGLVPDETETFRAHVRSWFETEFPKDIIAKYKAGTPLTTADVRRSEMALGANGGIWAEQFAIQCVATSMCTFAFWTRPS
jgi:hypothetical protein